MDRLEENRLLDYFEDLEDPRLGRKKLYLINEIPSDDTFRRFFRCIHPEEFRSRFIKWMKTFP
jgi:hypothetical protein